MKSIFKIIIATLFLTSCKRDKACWQGFSGGADYPGLVFCDKSQSELEAMYPGVLFYKEGEPKYCWRVKEIGGSIYYAFHIPTSIIDRSTDGSTHTQIDCSSACRWDILEKHRSKITGLYTPTQFYTETYTTADTCSKLYVGRVVVYRETTDSIITREFTKNW